MHYSAAFAAEEPPSEMEVSWGLAPGDGTEERTSYTFDVEPGDTVQDTLTVINYGVTPLQLDVYAADGLTTSSGDLDVKPAAESSTELGTWVEVEKDSIIVEPGHSEEVGLTISVPENVPPGETLGGIVTSQRSEGQGAVSVDRRLVLQALITVAGDVESAAAVPEVTVSAGHSWNPFAPVNAEIQATVENAGNTRAQIRSVVTADGIWGISQKRQVHEATEIIPGGRFTVDDTVRIWPTFITTVNVEAVPLAISGDIGASAVASVRVVTIPWGALVLVLIGLAAVITVVVKKRRRRSPRTSTSVKRPTSQHSLSATPPRPPGPRPDMH